MKISLTEAQKSNLELQHKSERDGRIRDRIKAVLLNSEGWTQRQIAQALRIHETTVAEHLNDYLYLEGKLKPENGGSISKLSFSLEDHTYTSTKDIIAYVATTYSITYTQQGMYDWLIKHGFSYKKPKESPAKADPVKQKQFIQEYEHLKRTTPSSQPILFMDSLHPTRATKVSYGWIKTGENKLIASIASRTRINITGAINLATMESIHQEYPTINAASTIDFFKQVENYYPNAPKIHVFLDQSGYHRSEEVAEFIKTSRIVLHFLPAYSPNLNPIERLWKVMNERVRNNKVFQTAKQFKSTVLGFFTDILPNITEQLRSRINDNFNIINPGSSI
ncbi:MAG: IS630 family transposase [Proteobacteria bacterium]|nr:IS630 family transposase [Pseudomonadota bacterium]